MVGNHYLSLPRNAHDIEHRRGYQGFVELHLNVNLQSTRLGGFAESIVSLHDVRKFEVCM